MVEKAFTFPSLSSDKRLIWLFDTPYRPSP
jgi:hypothetical protein